MIHSENDLRCAIEQGEQVYVALKRLGVETEMVRFPASPWAVPRGPHRPAHRARLEHMVGWFERYLK